MAYNRLLAFKSKYENSIDPFARQIIEQMKLLGNLYDWGYDDVPFVMIMFVPPLYYALL
jgi:hypothetical protein